MSLAELFPDGDHRFRLTLRRGEAGTFFRRQDQSGVLLAERRRWLDAEPARYAALRPEGEALFAEFVASCGEWGVRLPEERSVKTLGGAIEPDFLLLSPDADGRFRLRGGALCFPTGWGIDEKVGQTLDAIHDVVPGLNEAIGPAIHQFLARIKAGAAYLRDNWGIAGTDERNLHPSRAIAPPSGQVRLDRLWLRVEHQALVALPKSGGVLFGIRIALHRLDVVREDRTTREALARALAGMPEMLLQYKRLEGIRSGLLAALG